MLVGVAVLAVIAPAVDPGDNRAEAAPPALSAPPATTARLALEPLSVRPRLAAVPAVRLSVARMESTRLEASRTSAAASRSAARQTVRVPLAAPRFTRTAAAVGQAAKARPKAAPRVTARRVTGKVSVQRITGTASRQRATGKKTAHAGTGTVKIKRVRTRTTAGWRMRDRGMAAVIAYARSQVGKSYSSGADGPGAFDCSGFTMQAYRRAGLRLPHSSGAQAARAFTVSRSEARPGDLVVGDGHVGVYMGDGMMIDAGNPRVGVAFRPLYGGLHIERFDRY